MCGVTTKLAAPLVYNTRIAKHGITIPGWHWGAHWSLPGRCGYYLVRDDVFDVALAVTCSPDGLTDGKEIACELEKELDNISIQSIMGN